MVRHLLRLGLVFGLGLAAYTAAPAQDDKKQPKQQAPPRFEEDYRRFFKKPQTVQELWDALQFEIEVGRYDLAAAHLHALLAKKPGDQELIDLGLLDYCRPVLERRGLNV